MRVFAIIVLALLLGADPPAQSPGSGDGTITGKVIAVDGGKAAKRDEVFVYLEQVKPRRHRSTTPPPAREIRQKNESFVPQVLVVPVGTSVTFPNDDLEEHNVFSPTDPPGQFDLGRYTTDRKGRVHVFDDAGEIEIYCDIHMKMWARVKVVDTDLRWIAKVGADGAFRFEHVPPGSYKVHSWSYASDEVITPVEVSAGTTAALSELHLQLGKPHAHVRKDGRAYGPYDP